MPPCNCVIHWAFTALMLKVIIYSIYIYNYCNYKQILTILEGLRKVKMFPAIVICNCFQNISTSMTIINEGYFKEKCTISSKFLFASIMTPSIPWHIPPAEYSSSPQILDSGARPSVGAWPIMNVPCTGITSLSICDIMRCQCWSGKPRFVFKKTYYLEILMLNTQININTTLL